MTSDLQSARDDLAFVRALAQEGRQAPLLSGRMLLSAGVIYAGASLFDWAVIDRRIVAPFWWMSAIWVVATVVFIPFLLSSISALKAKPGATAVTNRAQGAAWMGIGWALFAIFGAFVTAAQVTHSALVFATLPSVVLAIYGAGWTIAAIVSRQRWLGWVAAACYATAVAVAFLVATPLLFLAYAAALILLLALPGWLLMRGEPSQIV